jgi:hypothetical protein
MRALSELPAAETVFDELEEQFKFIRQAYENQRAYERTGKHQWPRIDDAEFKGELPEIASLYLSTPGFQSAPRTDFLCKALLDTEIYPLKREMEDPSIAIPTIFGADVAAVVNRNRSSSGYGTWIGATALALFGLIFLVTELFWVGLILIGCGVSIVAARMRKQSKIKAGLAEISQRLRSIHGPMVSIRNEIEGGGYSASTMQVRLKNLESAGAYFPSIIYSLLESRSSK